MNLTLQRGLLTINMLVGQFWPCLYSSLDQFKKSFVFLLVSSSFHQFKRVGALSYVRWESTCLVLLITGINIFEDGTGFCCPDIGLLALILLYCLIIKVQCYPNLSLRQHVNHAKYGNALFGLKTSLGASSTQLTNWNPNEDNPCNWSNVICENDNYVTYVTLSSMNFSGSLSPGIGVLSTLLALKLNQNGITGVIPKEFGNLSSLTSLDLENNHLTGEIPSSLGNLKKLQFLSLSQNNLTRTIPDSLSGLPTLIVLFTGNNLNCGESSRNPCESNSDDSGASHKPSIGIVVAIVGGLVILLFVFFQAF